MGTTSSVDGSDGGLQSLMGTISLPSLPRRTTAAVSPWLPSACSNGSALPRLALTGQLSCLSSAVSGELGIFTPAWVTIGIVPPEGQEVKQGPIADGPETFAQILDKHPYYLNVEGW